MSWKNTGSGLSEITEREFPGAQRRSTSYASTQTEATSSGLSRPVQRVVPMARMGVSFWMMRRVTGRGERLLRHLEEQARPPAPRAFPVGEESSEEEEEVGSTNPTECGPQCLAWVWRGYRRCVRGARFCTDWQFYPPGPLVRVCQRGVISPSIIFSSSFLYCAPQYLA
ncbi:uncharacterized protein [Watersipora subatra]|uniref:uncharacterized protein n=1 Tax=Watersipora subatra TaxID=2589382 RepID=UPI00355B31F4